jgi:dipeptidyl aminopeptidase/acylaminoacyl peptidase
MKRISVVIFVVFLLSLSAICQTPFAVGDLLNVKRISDPQLSPDGKTVLYTVGVVDKVGNRTLTQIYSVSLGGGQPRQLSRGDKSSSNPRWSPDGRLVAYASGGQIWTMRPDGSATKKITDISTGASGPVWSPDGKWIAFNSDVYPECTNDACNKAEDERVEKNKVQAKVTDRLLYRHWVEWRDRKRTHVFVMSSDGGAAADFTPGDFDSPPYAAASGVDYAFSPDSKEIAFLKNPDKIEAISTNSDIIVSSLFDKNQKNITIANHGYDVAPVYTPDGKYIIYRSQATAGFESDRWRIMRYNRQTGENLELTRGFDQQAGEMAVTADSKTIYFTAELHGHSPIFSVPVEPDFRLRIGTFVKSVVNDVYAGGLNVSDDGSALVFASSSASSPAEIMKAGADGSGLTALTKTNESSLAQFHLQKVEDVNWRGAGTTQVHGFLLKPANFDPSKKYPLLVIIHGGPQGSLSDNWGFRWNYQVFANAGYVVFLPNPRGSTGWGQQFVNEVSADWGGRAFVDITNGVAEIIKRPYVDKTRIGAAGASYGGYMVDWILGHNTDPRFKFKALVSHAGVYNLESMAGATEELWFVNWEFKGMPWENRLNYDRWSPNKFVKNFSTPTLVTCGELDFRVPMDQSFQLYTALQLRGVDSKLIIIPDEGHWILKPQNSEFWYTNVLDWLRKHLNP